MTTAAVLDGDAAGYLADCAERLARSEVVAWLLKNHDGVVAATKRRTLRWEELAQRLFKDGVRNLRGGTPAGPSLRVTWYRVRKYVKEQRLEAQAAAERQAVEQAEEEARQNVRREVLKEAAKAEQARKTEEAAATRRKYEDAQRAAQWGREREQARLARSDQPQAATSQSSGPGQAHVGRIGEVPPVFRMLEAAPLYGADARKPAPPPYVGPRPAGMPDNLPLDALVSLDATGRDEQGNIDFKNMPGLPRRSFFENEFQWAQCCMPMIRAIPPSERSFTLGLMFNWLSSFPGIK